MFRFRITPEFVGNAIFDIGHTLVYYGPVLYAINFLRCFHADSIRNRLVIEELNKSIHDYNQRINEYNQNIVTGNNQSNKCLLLQDLMSTKDFDNLVVIKENHKNIDNTYCLKKNDKYIYD